MDDFNQLVKRYNRVHPEAVEGINNSQYFYYYDKLLKMIYTIFKFENAPEQWNMPYFKEKLYTRGVVAVVDTSLGVVPLETSYSGINLYGMPTDFNINNVVLGNLNGKIGIDGELIYFSISNKRYKSMNSLLNKYAVLLAEIDGSLNTTLINSRVAHIFEASSNAQMKTMEKVYDRISEGKPAVFIRKNGDESFEHALFNNVKQTYIGNDLLITKQTIMNEFMSEIGINNSNTQKRERLISSEVESNKSELSSNIYDWYNNLKECIDKVNKMFNLSIDFGFNEEVLHLNDNQKHIDAGGEEDV